MRLSLYWLCLSSLSTAWSASVCLLQGVAMQVACGVSHSVALLSNGQLWAWGCGVHGKLGNGGVGDSPVPVQVQMPVVRTPCSRTDVCSRWRVASSAGLALMHSHRVCLLIRLQVEVPVVVACGSSHSLALTHTGRVFAWGWNAMVPNSCHRCFFCLVVLAAVNVL